MEPSPAHLEALERCGTFKLSLLTSEAYRASRAEPWQRLPCHETVLRPLLRAAEHAWVYELAEDSEAYAAARTMLRRTSGKYAIDLGGEPIVGHELFWNIGGGGRGSVLMLMPMERFPAAAIFPHCRRAYVVGNPSTAHSPAAFRYAKSATASGERLACMLTRSNGMDWLTLHGQPAALETLLRQALVLVGE